jgi:hypothetical protein
VASGREASRHFSLLDVLEASVERQQFMKCASLGVELDACLLGDRRQRCPKNGPGLRVVAAGKRGLPFGPVST